MKLIAFIFGFYLFALAVMPCSDKDDCTYQNAEQYTFVNNNHTNHDSDSEHCTPFCICACCGQSFSYENLSSDLVINYNTIFEKLDFYKNSFVSEVFFSIWQPPKIS